MSIKKLWKNISFAVIFLICLCFHQITICQTNMSFAAHGGLVRTDGDYGRLLSGSTIILFNRAQGIELGYTNLEIENDLNDSYKTHRYSLLGTQLIYSSENLFHFATKIGPSLLTYSGLDENPVLGLDIGLETAFKLFDSLYLNFGVISTINKNTGNIAQIYSGFSYKIQFRKKE